LAEAYRAVERQKKNDKKICLEYGTDRKAHSLKKKKKKIRRIEGYRPIPPLLF
jgi:hypothetical protein